MPIIEVANFLRSDPHYVVTVLFDAKSKNPRIIGRDGYTHDKKADQLALKEAKKLLKQ